MIFFTVSSVTASLKGLLLTRMNGNWREVEETSFFKLSTREGGSFLRGKQE